MIISVNYIHKNVKPDYVYISNIRRYTYWQDIPEYVKAKKLLTSNIKAEADNSDELIFSFNKLIKCGWEHLDNSGLMVLRLLDNFDLKSIAIAGFDGYDSLSLNRRNYASEDIELANAAENPSSVNEEIESMLKDYKENRSKDFLIKFITDSRFEDIFNVC